MASRMAPGAWSLSRRSRRTERMLQHPIRDPRQAILLMVVLADSVTLARIEHQLSGLAAVLEATEELVGLAARHTLVVGPVQDQCRCGHVVDVGHRRPSSVKR